MAAVSKKKIIVSMEHLGIYKPEFDESIERYVALQKEYKQIYKQYVADDYQCTVDTASGIKKSPIVTTLESLRRDLLQLEESLGLTPRGLLKLQKKALEKPRNQVKNGLI